MILHIANLSTFIAPFVKYVDKNFCSKEHNFYLHGDAQKFYVEASDNVTITDGKQKSSFLHFIKLIPNLIVARKVILHGLFDIRIIMLLASMPFILNKCYWVIWGGDLYQYQKPKTKLKEKVKEFLRVFVIKRIGHLVTYIPGDVALAYKWYGASGQYHECLMYLSNTVDINFSKCELSHAKSTDKINILVGNSADPSNNHFEILDKLSRFKNRNIEVFIPLSYGDPDHARAVIDYGKRILGNKLTPIIEFMESSEYRRFLKSIDIAIFNHRRQQAMGNTISLLGLGKTVYMRSDVSQWSLFKSKGIHVRDIDRLHDLLLMPELQRTINLELVERYFSSERLKQQYKVIFK